MKFKIINDLFIRNHQSIDLLELFFISAISIILLTRSYLQITGFPQLGGGNLHIAHLLWGGLFMLLSILIFILFLSKGTKKIATILAGIGFGLFIDEIGKFITSDNNYFYKPSIAIIYICLIFIFLIIKFLQNYSNLSATANTLNALDYLQDIALGKFDEEKRKKALLLIKLSNHSDPLIKSISNLIEKSDYKKIDPNFFTIYLQKIKYLTKKILKSKYFQILIIIYFIFSSLFWIFVSVISVINSEIILDFISSAYLISIFLSSILALIGIYKLIRKNKNKAYQFFVYSILISIFISQIFLFVIDQFSSISTLFQNIIIYFALKAKLDELNNDS